MERKFFQKAILSPEVSPHLQGSPVLFTDFFGKLPVSLKFLRYV